MTLDATQRLVGPSVPREGQHHLSKCQNTNTQRTKGASAVARPRSFSARPCQPCASHAFPSAAKPSRAARILMCAAALPAATSRLETGSLATRLGEDGRSPRPSQSGWRSSVAPADCSQADDRGRPYRGAAAVAAVEEELRDLSHRGSHVPRGAQICHPHARARRPSADPEITRRPLPAWRQRGPTRG